MQPWAFEIARFSTTRSGRGWLVIIGRLDRRGSTARDNRLFVESRRWIVRAGSTPRDPAEAFGEWNSVFRRYRRWLEVGVFDAMLESLAEMVERDPSADMIDSTIVRAHHCAVGIKRGLSKQRRLVDRVAALPPNSMPAAMPKAARSASS